LIENWPLAKNRVEIPVRTDATLVPEERKGCNLLLVGGPSENAVTKAELERVSMTGTGNMVSYCERGWYKGDSFVAILGERGDRSKCFVEFLDWIRVWLDSSHKHVPERTW